MKKALLIVTALTLLIHTASAQWSTSGSNAYFNLSGNVGIGTTTPAAKLEVIGSGTTGGIQLSGFPFGGGVSSVAGASGGNLYLMPASNVVTILGGGSTSNISALEMYYGGSIKNYFCSNGNSFLTGGNVGIGTTSPSFALDFGNATSSVNQHTIALFANSGGANLFGFQFPLTGTNRVAVLSDGSERMSVLNNGNVGIGITAPIARLNVLSNNDVTSDFAFTYDASGNFRNAIGNSFDSGSSNGNVMSFLISDGTSTGQSKVMSLRGDGKVGIGTTNPDEMLTVNGKIHSTEVIVDLSVPAPDYVFNRTYKLRPLSDVRRYININKHLPEIPSAKAMAENGVNVSEMNMQLLKKVEELTLYLLDKDRQLEEQKKLIQIQQAKDQSLQQQLDLLKKQVSLLMNNNLTKK